MKKEEMTKIVNEELEHIPRTGRRIYDAQAKLRMFYNGMRRHDLKAEKTKEDTLRRCIELVKKDDADWRPRYDRNFFDLP
jgi:hypothetical protein